MHTELISFSATAPSTGAAAAALTGDSLTVKNARGPAQIIAWWAQQQVDGWQQLVTPTAHDTTRGYRTVVEANNIDSLIPRGTSIEVQPQELLSISIAGSGTAGDVELGMMLIHYPDLPGVSGRAITWPQLTSRMQMMTTVQMTITGAAAGYTGGELITAESDLLRANRDYAVIGVTTNVACGAITILGPDTGYVRTAVPGQASDSDVGSDWFAALSRTSGLPTIPVINSGNRAATTIGIVQNENNVSPVISITLALLR